MSQNMLHIPHSILGYHKTAGRWVPHTMSEVQHYATAQDLLHRYQMECDDFLGKIVTVDETWACSYRPHLKRQPNKWMHPGSTCPNKCALHRVV
jgi:hypothetical protein